MAGAHEGIKDNKEVQGSGRYGGCENYCTWNCQQKP